VFLPSSMNHLEADDVLERLSQIKWETVTKSPKNESSFEQDSTCVFVSPSWSTQAVGEVKDSRVRYTNRVLGRSRSKRQQWKLNSTLDLSSIHSEGSPPCLDRKLSFFCSHLVQEPSTQEALEDCSLLESIAGPEPLPVTTPLDQTSDPAHSLFAILPAGGGRERHVGDQLEALVLMNDFQGRPKSRGGDFLLARLHTPELGAAVAGQVLDHLNGTYSAIFPLLWEGSVWVEVTLVHPSEAVSLLRRLQEERLNWVPSKSLFRSGLLSETTECNLCLPNNQQPLCDYTDPRSGEPWFCYKPKQLACDTRINHFQTTTSDQQRSAVLPEVKHNVCVNKDSIQSARLKFSVVARFDIERQCYRGSEDCIHGQYVGSVGNDLLISQ
ncbi:unnamed protein product, partial [Oncorhynchus mykiss]